MLRHIFRLLYVSVLALAVALGLIFFFQARLIYFPTDSDPGEVAEFIATGGQRLDYVTSQGKQTAWLQLPRNRTVPERFWIVCAGNGSRALRFSYLQKVFALESDAFLLVDYPGYGESEGRPDPVTIRENLEKAVPLAAAMAHFPVEELSTRGIIFGHSLGCATSLLGANLFGIRRAVLLAPFTSMMEMTQVTLHAPLGWLARHRFDNRAELKKLAARGGRIWIFHGERDASIPVRMGRSLARDFGAAATFYEVPEGGHNDLLPRAHEAIAAAMREARK